MSDRIPFVPVNGRVLVEELPYKPSKLIECISIDKADRNEGIVVALSAHQLGRKKTRQGWEHTGVTFPHEVKVGDRVFFEGSYQDEDTMSFNGVKYRCMESWEIKGIMTVPQPEGWEDPMTGEMVTGEPPVYLFGNAA